MNASNRHPTVSAYLGRLRSSMRDLPADRRSEIVAEIEEHISAMLAELEGPPTDADVRNALERVGAPEDIAADARDRFGIAERSVQPRARWTDVAAVIMLLIGGVIIPIFGWLIGVVLLWISDVWNTRDKILGTLLVPGGLAFVLFLGVLSARGGGTGSCVITPEGVELCSGTAGGSSLGLVEIILIAFFLLAPIAMAAYLTSKLRFSNRAAG